MRTLLALLLSALLTVPAYGASLSDFPVIGAERMDSTADTDRILSSIPDGVAVLYREKGGTVYIVDYSLDSRAKRCGVSGPGVVGLYFWTTCDIWLTAQGDWRTGYAMAHELGHFLFHETRPSWTAEAKARWPDDEDFAKTYATHCAFHCLTAEDAALMGDIEVAAEHLLQWGGQH